MKSKSTYKSKGKSFNKVKFWKHYKEAKKLLRNRKLPVTSGVIALG